MHALPAADEPEFIVDDIEPNKTYQRRANLNRLELRGRDQPLPWEPVSAGAAPQELEARRCMYTGDDLPAQRARPDRVQKVMDDAWRFGAGMRPGLSQLPMPAKEVAKHYATPDALAPPPDAAAVAEKPLPASRNNRCMFTGDDLPPPASRPDSLRRLSEWKTRMVMPETIDQLQGFERQERPGTGARGQDGVWSHERAWREMRSDDAKVDATKRRVDVDKEVANKLDNAYGMRVPPRKKGELLPPWAPR